MHSSVREKTKIKHSGRSLLAALLAFALLAGCGGGGGGGTSAGLRLTADVGARFAVGTRSNWTVMPPPGAALWFEFSVGLEGGPLDIVSHLGPENTFSWTPLVEGNYVMRVKVRDNNTKTITELRRFPVVDAIASTAAVVSATDNPLVALYSLPPCSVDQQLQVHFGPDSGPMDSSTNVVPCSSDSSTNIYIAGMTENTIYSIQHELLDFRGAHVSFGPVLLFQTGAITITFPEQTITSPPTASSSLADDVLLQTIIPTPTTGQVPLFATDLAGNVVWYLDGQPPTAFVLLYRSLPGGRFLLRVTDQLLEVGLGGNVIRQINVQRLSEMVMAMGGDPLVSAHHEALRLPNGDTALLGFVERLVDGLDGPEPTAVLADTIIVLDENFDVVWVWNGFDFLDVDRRAILGELCTDGQGGCPEDITADVADDWMHSNALTYSPEDGNLLVSVRHQDWIIKVDYRDGAGDGDIIWRLGREGDFTIVSSDPDPWFTHAHQPELVAPNRLSVFDNGNTRVEESGVPFSRGQVYELDEENMVATLIVNADLGNYSPALGSSQGLSNGNLHFNAGRQGTPDEALATSIEVMPDGTRDFELQTLAWVYRSFRMQDLYSISGGE